MKLRKNVRLYIRKKLGVQSENRNLQDQFNFLSALVNLGLPEVLTPDENTRSSYMSFFKEKYGITDFYSGIHKNDIMFQHSLYHHSNDMATAFRAYFNVGISNAKVCSELARKHGFKGNTFLDFGSGYGRVSRFLPFYFPGIDITVTEVKPMAMEFQKAQFPFKTISHSTAAASFPNAGFDLIFASSVFTHLPESHFREWFARLCQALNDQGLLLISFNNITETHTGSHPDFLYSSHSEDSAFMVSDRLGSAENYGLTYVSKAFLEELAHENGLTIKFPEKDNPKRQDMAVILR